jgi:anti-sigma B factor antagonist
MCGAADYSLMKLTAFHFCRRRRRKRRQSAHGERQPIAASSAETLGHTTSSVCRSALIPRAGEMDSELPFFTTIVEMPVSPDKQAHTTMTMPLFRSRTRNAGLYNSALDAGEITIRVVPESSQSTVTVTGRVTIDSSPHLRSVLLQLLRRGAGPVVIIDLLGVSYLNMSGLATLLEALKAARQRAVTLRVIGITGQSRMLAEVAELDKVFEAEGSEVEFR